jgi:hypothetical protein
VTLKSRQNPIAQLLLTRVAAVEAITLAVSFGLAINLISSVIGERFKDNQLWLVFGSTVLIILTIFWIWWRVAQKLVSEDYWEGVIGLEPGTSNFINLIIYPFSQNVYRFIQGLFRVKPDLLEAWKSANAATVSPQVILSSWYGSIKRSARTVESSGSALIKELVTDAAEAYVFIIISDSLVSYAKKSPMIKLTRMDQSALDSVSKENLILKTISAPNTALGADAAYSVSGQGDLYQNLQIYIPEGSALFRSDHGGIILKTKRIEIEFTAGFPGVKHYEAPEFALLYLNREPQTVDLFKVVVRTKITVLRKGLTDFKDWWEDRWLDALQDEFRAKIDFGEFKSRVNFDAALFNVRLNLIAASKQTRDTNGGGEHG